MPGSPTGLLVLVHEHQQLVIQQRDHHRKPGDDHANQGRAKRHGGCCEWFGQLAHLLVRRKGVGRNESESRRQEVPGPDDLVTESPAARDESPDLRLPLAHSNRSRTCLAIHDQMFSAVSMSSEITATCRRVPNFQVRRRPSLMPDAVRLPLPCSVIWAKAPCTHGAVGFSPSPRGATATISARSAWVCVMTSSKFLASSRNPGLGLRTTALILWMLSTDLTNSSNSVGSGKRNTDQRGSSWGRRGL